MNKPELSPPLPGFFPLRQQGTSPSGVVQPTHLVGRARRQQPISPTRPGESAPVSEYVDPYLFETGYYANPAEYQELARTANSRIQLRADAEQSPVQKRQRLRPKE